MGNLSMTAHPMHLHGVDFRVTMTDGGWIPESAQWPEATTDVPVGAVRALEFVADAPGDWAFHCHKSHHTMNAMGHKVKNFIGLARADLGRAVDVAAPTAMAMGTDGMADMAAMSMPLPTNTLPMMTGTGPFGGIEMGGMFSVVKVREGLAAGDYRDPGWYKHPAGTVAHEVDVAIAGAGQGAGGVERRRNAGHGHAGHGHAGHEIRRTSRSPLVPGAITDRRQSHLSAKGRAACASGFSRSSLLDHLF
jgi:hypothetical protein